MDEVIIYYEGGEVKSSGVNAEGHDILSTKDFSIPSLDFVVINTKIRLLIPRGYWIKIEGKSSLAVRGIFPIGGIIDNDYTGEVKIALVNMGELAYFKKGQKIAQFVVYCHHDAAFIKAKFEEDKVLKYRLEQKALTRGVNGFGSTGAF